MYIINDPELLRAKISELKQQKSAIAFVPTMGNLHKGHLQLVDQAKKKAQTVVVSIFVNPMQFNNSEDLQNYPKTVAADTQLLEQQGVDIVFIPSADVIYPNGLEKQSYVEVPGLSDSLEGALRPGHFRGMSTIVNKLFNLVQPDYACFGEKDFQQLLIVKQMVADLAIPVEIISVPTVREKSGLAMSSRNGKLTLAEKEKAPFLAQLMNKIATALDNQQTDYAILTEQASRELDSHGFRTDAINIVDSSTLQNVSSNTKQVVILMAAFLGGTRLIDNKTVNLRH
ncbi:pantoate--beta-alanine ligase [Psychromonas antarctica]|uniref:pantoate--beta-alanine ligase n=1 Tax=Psychromonas antarctica TaxID=67573 RepID=UPI001EE9A5B2|nr:pantoate--beta-alanine ligase [Psychromonas antarctica]MCG6201034.1 pantoate--beta-alanine ligase [Psychromonas antarctica]